MTAKNDTWTDNELAEESRAYVFDEDEAPELTAERAARLRPACDVLPEYVLAQFPRSKGRPRSPSPKKQLTLRLDAEVVDYFKAGGEGWQSRMNAALRRSAGFTD